MVDPIPTAARLAAAGAYRGACQVLFNAEIQRQPLKLWTPSGPLPVKRREHRA